MPTPVLLLKPEGSRDVNGAVTPTLTNCASSSGQYGEAWTKGESWQVPLVNIAMVSDASGHTAIYRYKSQSYRSELRVSDAEQAAFAVCGPWGFDVTDGNDEWGGAYPDMPSLPTGWVWGGMAWDSSSIIGVTPLGTVSNGNAAVFSSLRLLSIEVKDPGGFVESVAVFAETLTPEQIAAIATMPESWTWENLSSDGPEPPAPTTGPHIVGAPHLSGIPTLIGA